MTRVEKLITGIVLAVNLSVGAYLVSRSDYSALIEPVPEAANNRVVALAP